MTIAPGAAYARVFVRRMPLKYALINGGSTGPVSRGNARVAAYVLKFAHLSAAIRMRMR